MANDNSPATGAAITSLKDFKKTPSGQYKYWCEELNASMKARKKWWKQGDKIVKRYKGQSTSATQIEDFNLNLFHSNTKTLENMLYGNTPTIDVSRRYAQPDDDPARVAAEMMERLLNLDLADNGAEIDAVLRSALQDRLLPGLGCAKVRYEADIREVNGVEQLLSESAPTEYHYWGDVLWSWGRNWADLRWIAFRQYLTRDEIAERWGEKVAQAVKLKKQTANTSDDSREEDNEVDGAWERAEIWEIWDKTAKKVRWLSIGYDKQLEEKPDPLELSGFWPCPPFLLANPTTSLYAPTPDFALAQDLYNEINLLQNRISTITEAVKVIGVYNASADNVKQMFSDGVDNQLIPVENWALFGENGGLAGQVEWLPLKDIVEALRELISIRDQTIALLQQITGMTDVMRGALDNQYEGVGQTEVKTKFGSVRIQALQEQFARFASDLMQLKAEVIARHFSPQTIVQMSNMAYSKDRDLVPQAVELIKNPYTAKLRISIRPESLAMVDYQALKGERTEYLNAVSTYLQSAAGILSEDPKAKPFILQLMQWGLAGFKGSSEIEGVLDKAIEETQKEAEKPQQQPPSEAAISAQSAEKLAQLRMQGDQAKIKEKAAADERLRQLDMQADIATLRETHQARLTEIEAGLQAKSAEINMKLEADLLSEKAQAASNIAQTQASVDGEIEKDIVEHKIDMEAESVKTANKMTETLHSALADIGKQNAQDTDGDDD